MPPLLKKLAPLRGLEPPTLRLEGAYSIPIELKRHIWCGMLDLNQRPPACKADARPS